MKVRVGNETEIGKVIRAASVIWIDYVCTRSTRKNIVYIVYLGGMYKAVTRGRPTPIRGRVYARTRSRSRTYRRVFISARLRVFARDAVIDSGGRAAPCIQCTAITRVICARWEINYAHISSLMNLLLTVAYRVNKVSFRPLIERERV